MCGGVEWAPILSAFKHFEKKTNSICAKKVVFFAKRYSDEKKAYRWRITLTAEHLFRDTLLNI